MRDVARGIAYLHSLKPPIAHGFISPGSILITNDLKAVLCNFRWSRVMIPEPLHTGFTTTGSLIPGEPGFQAKEQILGDARATPMGDVYGMGGVILYVRFVHPITLPESVNWFVEMAHRQCQGRGLSIRPGPTPGWLS